MSDPVNAYDRLIRDLAGELDALAAAGLERTCRVIDAVDGPEVVLEGRRVVAWCTNDYLGLSTHPRVTQAAAAAAAAWGAGSRASRLLAGTTSIHARLERALAAWHGTEAALVFPSGTQTNAGLLAALLTRDDAVVLDRLAHASLVDGARASGARLRVFQHNDPAHAAQVLARLGARRRRLLVTEGIFSMEGDRAPLPDLLEAARAHGALLLVDDAHGAFVEGPQGRGSPDAWNLPVDGFLYMATLGKALGAQGGFVAGPRLLIDALISRARPFMYSTALAVPVAAAALAALQVLEHDSQPRADLAQRSAWLHEALGTAGLPRPPGPSHIVPIILGESDRAVAASARLLARGHWAPAIRPPTVPRGRARLRLSLTARHTRVQIEDLTGALADVWAGAEAEVS